MDDEDLDSDMEDIETAGEDGERIIYPWMKKIHVAGVGKFHILFYAFKMAPFCNMNNIITLRYFCIIKYKNIKC